MKTLSVLTRGALSVCVVVAISACSQSPVNGVVPQNGSSAVAPRAQSTPLTAPPGAHRRAGWLLSQAEKAARLIYVAGADGIVVLSEKGRRQKPIGEITAGVSGAYGLFVDPFGTLYVANAGNNTVSVYPLGSKLPDAVFSQDLNRPLYPTVDSVGDLFVGNANNGTVVEYLVGSKTPYRVLHTPGVEADGMAFDAKGNLYVAYRGYDGQGSIEEFAPGSSTGKVLGMALNQPQGVLVDESGNILAVETGPVDRVDVFPPGQTVPSAELPVSTTPTEIALKSYDTQLFVSSLAGVIYGAHYPFTMPARKYKKDKLRALIQGVAINNGQLP